MRKGIMLATCCALLAGCSSQDDGDFTIDVHRPVAEAMAPFAKLDLSTAESLFPGLEARKMPSANDTILYAIPGDNGEATVRLRFEEQDGGKSTVIHATVDLPDTENTIDGQQQMLDEPKVQDRLAATLREVAGHVDAGTTSPADGRLFAARIAGIAVAIRKPLLDLALDVRRKNGKIGGLDADLGYSPKPGAEPAASAAPTLTVEARDEALADEGENEPAATEEPSTEN